MLSPRYNPSLPPRFYEMDEYAFEEMCQDLFAKESGIATCNTYGVRGQLQSGINLLAHCDDVTFTEVGQLRSCTILKRGCKKTRDMKKRA
ncbi:MAG: hypothetical protein IM537_14975 [Pseudanabaena sp. M57BS1SP1A06MG]|nr:hypothetical protein [Pseudanabaena sp. M57BS1SP1A06MG]